MQAGNNKDYKSIYTLKKELARTCSGRFIKQQELLKLEAIK